MSLISLPFFIFMCCFLGAYYNAGEKHQWKVLLIGNAFFYICSNPVYIIFIAISIVSTWYLMRNPIKRNFMLTIAINLGLLIAFKYSVNLGIRDLVAPLGISFYTFMTLGYAHDCYDKKIKPCDNLWHYALFISYFPQLTQGPIGTYQEMRDQLTSYHGYDRENIKEGGYRIIIGVFKKLVIAGRVGFYIDTVYSSPKSYSGLTLITATIFYLIEMYADFSGYMDIVCGVSKMLGIRLKENFRRPYLSKSIPEYWRRWHISLNEWFMNHLYMPSVTAGWNRKLSRALGKVFTKAKKGTLRLIFPTMLVWIVTGIWHGAKFSYLGWGIYFAFVMLVSFCTQSYVKRLNAKIHWNPDNIFIKIFQVARTLLILSFGEIIYRSECFADTVAIFKGIITNTRINGAEIAAAMTPFGNGNQAAASMLIIAVLVTAQAVIEISKEKDEKAFTGHRYAYAFAMLVVIALFGVAGKSSFMYQAF
ncbi:MAG: MBOAT family protein [Lachnospiraceae bacterium]|nr:MBOAT family protein [Lachnospiraceae bacterium]